MTNTISTIQIGSRHTLAAKGNTPETAVKVISIKGRWVKVAAESNGAELNVAAKDLTPITEKALAKNGLVSSENRAKYFRTKLGDGIVAIDNGDEIAAALRGMELDDVYIIAAQCLGGTAKALHDKYEHLNPGMQRMSLGNRIRKAVRNDPTLRSALK